MRDFRRVRSALALCVMAALGAFTKQLHNWERNLAHMQDQLVNVQRELAQTQQHEQRQYAEPTESQAQVATQAASTAIALSHQNAVSSGNVAAKPLTAHAINKTNATGPATREAQPMGTAAAPSGMVKITEPSKPPGSWPPPRGTCALRAGEDSMGGDITSKWPDTSSGPFFGLSEGACCSACWAHKSCASAVRCGEGSKSVCYLKDLTASPGVASQQCDTMLTDRDDGADHGGFLPNADNASEIVRMMPTHVDAHVDKAWSLLKDRILHNAQRWTGVNFPELHSKPLRIMVMYSPAVKYKMDWKSGEQLQWGDL